MSEQAETTEQNGEQVQDDEQPEHHHPNYLYIWLGLMILFGGQILLDEILGFREMAYAGYVVMILGVATVKTVMIGLYFMHLRWESRVIQFMVFSPLAVLIFLLSILVFDNPFVAI